MVFAVADKERRKKQWILPIPLTESWQSYSTRIWDFKVNKKDKWAKFEDSILAVLRVEDVMNSRILSIKQTHVHLQYKIDLKPIWINRMCKFIWSWFVLLRQKYTHVCLYCFGCESCNKSIKFYRGGSMFIWISLRAQNLSRTPFRLSFVRSLSLLYSPTCTYNTFVNEK